METVRILVRSRSRDVAAGLEKLQEWIAALFQNGQVLGRQTPIANVRRGFEVFANVPEANSLDHRFDNKWVRKRLRQFAGVGLDQPEVTVIGSDPEGLPPCKCRRRPFLILFTTFLHDEPPVRCGACFGPVALYKLPVIGVSGNYQDVLWWQETYQAIDWLFIGTGPGERFAHDQLARFDSELSKDGRDLARVLERKTRVPVYYYLSKHFGRSDHVERKRRCPSCGGTWLRAEPLHGIYDFQCRRCRLVSNVAFDVRLNRPVVPDSRRRRSTPTP